MLLTLIRGQISFPMIPAVRQRYNAAFTEQRYAAFIAELNQAVYWPVDFRVAESPLFLDEATTLELVRAAENIVGQLARPEFRKHAAHAIPMLANPAWNASLPTATAPRCST